MSVRLVLEFKPGEMTAKAGTCIPAAYYDPVTGGLSVTLRHAPHPGSWGKNPTSGGSFDAYTASFVNTANSRQKHLGVLNKVRPGVYSLECQNVDCRGWDQLVIQVTDSRAASTQHTGLVVFTAPLPPPVPKEEPQPRPQPPETKTPFPESPQFGLPVHPAKESVAPPRPEPPPEPRETVQPLIAKVKVPPAAPPGTTKAKPRQSAPTPPPPAANTAREHRPTAIPSLPQLTPLTLGLPNHVLWQIYYYGTQLLGYVHPQHNPRKILYMVHGVPGEFTRQSQPYRGSTGYVYWVPADRKGTAGFWLRYTDLTTNTTVYPYPVPPSPPQ